MSRSLPPRRALLVARLSLALAPKPSREFRRRANRIDAWVQRACGRSWSSLVSGLPMLLLTTVGRRTGQPRTVALAYARVRGALFVVGGDHGAQVDPHWYRNLCAEPAVLVELGRQRVGARAVPVSGDVRDALWPLLARQLPVIELYRARSQRKIPVVRLDLDAARGALPKSSASGSVISGARPAPDWIRGR